MDFVFCQLNVIVSVTDTGLFNKKEGRFMKKLISFENSDIQVLQISGVWYFELYSIGMALGQVRIAKGKSYPRKDRIDENVKNAEIKPVVRNGQPYITEEQVYDLMLETRTDKCRVFRKWLTNEVLPELNHTGKYEMKKPDPKPYEYFDKTYNGEPVLTAIDIERLTGIPRNNTDYQAKHNFNNGKDYFLLVKNELKKFKQENPKVNRLASSIMIITQSGFKKLCKIYGVTVEEPKCFEVKETPKKSAVSKIFDTFKKHYYIKNCALTDDIVESLKTDRNNFVNNNHMLRFLGDNKYFMVCDDIAPILQRQCMIAENLGHILAGTLRENANPNVNYQQDARTFAMVVMALSLYFDNNN